MVRKLRASIGRQRIDTFVRLSEAGAVRDSREAIRKVHEKLELAIKEIGDVASPIIRKALEPTFELAKYYTPKDTKALVNSGALTDGKGARGPFVAISFGKGGYPFYAAYVHERTDIFHAPPTRAKYLSSAMEEDLSNIKDRLLSLHKEFLT